MLKVISFTSLLLSFSLGYAMNLPVKGVAVGSFEADGSSWGFSADLRNKFTECMQFFANIYSDMPGLFSDNEVRFIQNYAAAHTDERCVQIMKIHKTCLGEDVDTWLVYKYKALFSHPYLRLLVTKIASECTQSTFSRDKLQGELDRIGNLLFKALAFSIMKRAHDNCKMDIAENSIKIIRIPIKDGGFFMVNTPSFEGSKFDYLLSCLLLEMPKKTEPFNEGLLKIGWEQAGHQGRWFRCVITEEYATFYLLERPSNLLDDQLTTADAQI